MGDIWYDALRGIPDGWIQPPEGNDPVRPPHAAGADPNANGGPDPVVATPTYGIDYVQGTNPAAVQSAASSGKYTAAIRFRLPLLLYSVAVMGLF